MGPVNIQFGLSWRDTFSTPAFRVAFLLVILVFLGSHAPSSTAHSDDQPTAEDLTTVETPPPPTSEEAETLKSETSAEPSEEGEGERGDESTNGKQDIAPALDDADSTESESKADAATSDDIETEQVTKVVILVQGNAGTLNPIRGAEVFVSIKDHDDVQTSTNAKGLANISVPSGRVKIQVTAKDWKTFGEFYELNGEMEEINITLESRKPGEQ